MARATLDVPITCPEGPMRCAECAECVRQRLLQRAGVRNVQIRRNHTSATIELDYDAALLTRAELQRDVTRSGGCFAPEWGHAVLPIEGMVSPQSEQLIEAALNRMPGVMATASYASQLVRVEFDKRKCLVPDILRTLRRIGYRVRPARSLEEATPPGPDTGESAARGPLLWTWRTLAHPELAFPLAGALLLTVSWLLSAYGSIRPVAMILVALSYILAARFTAIETFRTLRHLRFDVDVLMFLAAAGAVAIGRYEEGALLLVLFGLGTAGENLAMDKARGAIKALAKLAPETARIRDTDGTERLVAVKDLRIGDQVVVRPFDRVPVDGTVTSGNSAVDQSPITGESIPVEKSAGSPIFAGAINGQGSLLVEVTRPADDSKLAQIIRLVEEAQTTKSPTQALTDRVERWYVPCVLVATCMLIVLPPLAAGDWSTWFYRAMAFLTAASPCALAIGTPAAVLSGIARAARGGVLIKGGVHLENLGLVRAVAFDKTGTLTRGRPQVTDVVTLSDIDADELLALAASVEQQSTHPLATAIVVEAQVRGCELRPTERVEQVSGAGVTGMVAGQRVFVGHARHAPSAGDTMRRAVEELESAGRTVVVVAVGDQPAGVLGLIDPPRSNSAAVMKRLAELGVKRTVMITGDNARVAAQIAASIGVQDFHADLLPADKVTVLKRIESEAGRVAMVGDGVNDAPALAAATVGIAMGTAGADVALETADVALMADDLGKLPEAIGLSRFSRRIIAQNLLIALGVIACLAPAAALGYASLGLAVVFHEGSTVLVVLNALRLLAYRDAAETRADSD